MEFHSERMSWTTKSELQRSCKLISSSSTRKAKSTCSQRRTENLPRARILEFLKILDEEQKETQIHVLSWAPSLT